MNNGSKRLIEVNQGTQVRITAIEGEIRYTAKLNQFGLYPGDLAVVMRFAPFDGPVLLEVRGMEIALGKSLAEHILVEVLSCDSC
jgi:Fe2+ transport system protein FeoA